MRFKKLLWSTMILFILEFNGLYAQETYPTTGGNASGSGGSVSYSVGQLADTAPI